MDTKIFLAKLNKKIKTDDYIKYILKEYYNTENISILRGKNGKPYIKNSKISFSISHKNDYMVAVFANNDIGIDLEILNDKDYSKIIKRYFFDDEKDYVLYDDLKNNYDKNRKFFEIWTRKEAYIKKYALNIAYIKKINSLQEDIFTFCIDDLVISVCK